MASTPIVGIRSPLPGITRGISHIANLTSPLPQFNANNGVYQFPNPITVTSILPNSGGGSGGGSVGYGG